jgi:hypothetical protein
MRNYQHSVVGEEKFYILWWVGLVAREWVASNSYKNTEFWWEVNSLLIK